MAEAMRVMSQAQENERQIQPQLLVPNLALMIYTPNQSIHDQNF